MGLDIYVRVVVGVEVETSDLVTSAVVPDTCEHGPFRGTDKFCCECGKMTGSVKTVQRLCDMVTTKDHPDDAIESLRQGSQDNNCSVNGLELVTKRVSYGDPAWKGQYVAGKTVYDERIYRDHDAGVLDPIDWADVTAAATFVRERSPWPSSRPVRVFVLPFLSY